MSKNLKDTDSRRLFCRLIREGKLSAVKALLESGQARDFEHRNPRCTPLGIAIETGFHDIVESLLRSGFSPRSSSTTASIASLAGTRSDFPAGGLAIFTQVWSKTRPKQRNGR